MDFRERIFLLICCSSIFLLSYNPRTPHLAEISLADIYGYHEYNTHAYIPVRTAVDSAKGWSWTIADLQKKHYIIPALYSHIFDYFINADSILHIIAAKNYPKDPAKPQAGDTVVLARYRWDLKANTLIDTLCIFELFYTNYDRLGSIGAKIPGGSDKVNTYLTTTGPPFYNPPGDNMQQHLYPRMTQEFVVQRNLADSSFMLTFVNRLPGVLVKKVNVQQGYNLLVQLNDGQYIYNNNSGSVTRGPFARALNFPKHNPFFTAAFKADGSLYLITGKTLDEKQIKFPDDYKADSIRTFFGLNKMMMVRLIKDNDTIWGIYNTDDESVKTDHEFRYTDIQPLFALKDEGYFIGREKTNAGIAIYKYEKGKKDRMIHLLEPYTLQGFEILSVMRQKQEARLVLKHKNSKYSYLIDMRITPREPIDKVDISEIDKISAYYTMEDHVAVESSNGFWYTRQLDPYSKDRPRQECLAEKLKLIMPFTSISITPGKKRLVAMAKRLGRDNKQHIVYLDENGIVYDDWWEWYKNNNLVSNANQTSRLY